MTQEDRNVLLRPRATDRETLNRWLADVTDVFSRRFQIPTTVSLPFGRFYVEAVLRQGVLKRHVDQLITERQQLEADKIDLRTRLLDVQREAVLSKLKAWELSSLIDVMSLDLDTLDLPSADDIRAGFAHAAPDPPFAP
jgi:hypothetical protein